jgi:hypothetical protein
MSVHGKCLDILLFLIALTMFCMGVVMIHIGISRFGYEKDVSTYLIVGGIFVTISYLGVCLPLFRQIYLIDTMDQCLLLCFAIPFGLVYLCILIWGTVIASGNNSSSKFKHLSRAWHLFIYCSA